MTGKGGKEKSREEEEMPWNYREQFKGKIYSFQLGEIDDSLVEECRSLLKDYCQIQVEEESINPNTIGYAIGKGERTVDDELLFQAAIVHYKEYLAEQVKEHNSHIIVIKKNPF